MSSPEMELSPEQRVALARASLRRLYPSAYELFLHELHDSSFANPFGCFHAVLTELERLAARELASRGVS